MDNNYINLFMNNFEKYKNMIKNNKFDEFNEYDNYKWNNNMDKIFINLSQKLLKNENDFIKNYYELILIFINYANFLKFTYFIKNTDDDLDNIFKFIDNLKMNESITKNLLSNPENAHNENIINIIKIYEPFTSVKLKLNLSKNKDNLIDTYIKNIKQFSKILETDSIDISPKKILNINKK